jgi:protein required for attachment to host cells
MKAAYVVVADLSRAVIYSISHPGAPLTTQETHSWPRAELRTHELAAGRLGRGAGHHARTFLPRRPPRDVEEEHAAWALALRIDRLVASSKNELVLVMAPRVLGRVLAHLSERAQQQIVATVQRDLVHAPRDSLVEHVRQVWPVADAPVEMRAR